MQLLSSLTDDELQHYGKIAADQRRLEWQLAPAQIALGAGAMLALGWFVMEFATKGLSWRSLTVLGLAGALGYWPYRRAVVRRLWGKHCKAVAREQERRRLKKNV